MTRRPAPSWNEERRNAQIRRLREQREGPVRRRARRRVEPLLLVLWLALSIAAVGFLIVLGFNLLFAPRVMAWVEENPGAIEHGIVQDFVEWYRPEVLNDEPAGDEAERVTVTIETGATATSIGEELAELGLIKSEIAFQYAVIQAGREATLPVGVYDLFPTMRPSEIVAALQGQPFGEVTNVTIREGLRLEEVVAAFADSSMIMNTEEFAALLQAPPADIVNEFPFLADLPADRSLEGYIRPDTYEFQVSGEEATPRAVIFALLRQFAARLTPEIEEGIAARGLTLDEAVIIASLVEREAVIDEERPMIAAVYTNRFLQPDNPQTVGLLNADPTLQYGLATADLRPIGHPMLANTEGAFLPVDEWGSVEWWGPLQTGGGEVVLPENLGGFQTYAVKGLPPMPIAAPRTASLEAVATAPLDDGFLFFVAGCPGGTRDGSHYFARSLDEHNANVARASEECAGQ
jgi:UPF0755 protein